MTTTAQRDGHLVPHPRPAQAFPAAPPAISPAEWEAWRLRLELDDQVRAAAATVVESRMPAAPVGSGRSGTVRAVALVAAATAVTAGYVGLPLALATQAVLGALPQALVLAAALVVLSTVGVLGVLRRTSTVLAPRGSRRDSARRDRRAARPAGPTAPPAGPTAPPAGPTAPPAGPSAGPPAFPAALQGRRRTGSRRAGQHRPGPRTQPAGRRPRYDAPAGR